MRKKELLLLAILCCIQVNLGADNYSMSTKLAISDFTMVNNLIMVKASINGKEGNFILDTGAETLTLNKKNFNTTTLLDNKRKVVDIGSIQYGLKDYKVNHFEWAGLKRKNFMALALDLSQMEKVLGVPLMGLIGYQVLKNVELQIDFADQKLRTLQIGKDGVPLLQLDNETPDYRLPFKRMKYLPVINASLGSEKISIVIDSGAAVNLVEEKLTKKLAPLAIQQRDVTIAGVFSKPQRVNFYTFDNLNIAGKVGIKYWQTVFSDLSHLRESGLYIDGIMGINSFRSGKLTLNYKKKELKFWLLDNSYPNKLVPQKELELTEE